MELYKELLDYYLNTNDKQKIIKYANLLIYYDVHRDNMFNIICKNIKLNELNGNYIHLNIKPYDEKYFTSNFSIITYKNIYKCIIRNTFISGNNGIHNYICHNKNLIIYLNESFEIINDYKLIYDDDNQSKNVQFRGLEDARIIEVSDNQMIFSCTHFCDKFNTPNLEHISYVKTELLNDNYHINSITCLKSLAIKEKNWLFDDNDNIIYHWYPFKILKFNKTTNTYIEYYQRIYKCMKHWEGSARPMKFNNYYIALVHDSNVYNNKHIFLHRLVLLNSELIPIRYSNLFTFDNNVLQIEYCCGMCLSICNTNIIFSFTCIDKNPTLYVVNKNIILDFINYTIE